MAGAFRMRACGVLVHEDRMLLIECQGDTMGRHYNLPGGGVETGEAIRDAVRRELREETGYEVEVGELLLTFESLHEDAVLPEEKHHGYGMLFACSMVEGAPLHEPSLPDDFQTGIVWMPLNRLLTLPLLPDIGADLLAALRGGTDAPTFARHTYVPRKLWGEHSEKGQG